MKLNELDQWLAERNLGGHRNRQSDQSLARPFLWKWSDIYQGLMWANELVPIEKTGRRTIIPRNLGLKVGMTPTIHIGFHAWPVPARISDFFTASGGLRGDFLRRRRYELA